MSQVAGMVPYIGQYIITSPYGPRTDPVTGKPNSFHFGVDLVGIDEKTIYCTIYGTVDHMGWENPDNPQQGGGYYARIIEDQTGRMFYFMHMIANSGLVSVGQKVAPGTPLGTEGATGAATGRHCHYQAGPSRQNGTINIMTLMSVPDVLQTGFTSELAGVLADPTKVSTPQAPVIPYQAESTKGDATVREVAYADSKLSPSINLSNIKLSAVNISDVVNAVSYLQPSRTTAITYFNGTTSMAGVPRAIFEFLVNKGYPAASACGILGNIEAESDFNTADLGDYVNGIPTSFGLCQWHYGRGDAMKQMAGTDWANNLTGQCNYLDYELRTSYTSLLRILLAEPNNDVGVKDAADKFVRMFEVPANVDQQSIKRQANAEGFWTQISITGTVTV
jgi:murein DD-endopeptidase MepM/ murein hydrolase activator NlpD